MTHRGPGVIVISFPLLSTGVLLVGLDMLCDGVVELHHFCQLRGFSSVDMGWQAATSDKYKSGQRGTKVSF